MARLLSATRIIDELLKHFETNKIESRSQRVKYGIVTRKIKKILDIDITQDLHIEALSQDILSTIEEIIKSNAYRNCDDFTACFIMKLFSYYHGIIMDIPNKLSMISNNNNNNNSELSEEKEKENKYDKEQQSKHNKVRWKILMVITESLISYFYKHNILNNKLIWTDIIQNTLLSYQSTENSNSKNSITTKRKVLVLIQLMTGCGEKLISENENELILNETKLFFKRYIINYIPTIKYAKQELINMKRICSILQLINDKILHNINLKMEKKENINVNINANMNNNKKKKKKKKKRKKNNNNNALYTENEDEQILTSQMERYSMDSKLNNFEKEKRNKLIANIDRLWKKVLFEWYPSLKQNYKSFDKQNYITIYGSVATDLDIKSNSWIDIYLTIPSHLTLQQMDENEILKQLSRELNNNSFKSSDISDCTSPAILVNDIENNININISYDEYNDKSKIVNLINLLCDYDSNNNNRNRIKEFILSIKHWSKQRCINSSKSQLNSFGFMLLIFKYLQSKCILPILTKTRSRNGYHIQFEMENEKKENKKSKSKSSKKNQNKLNKKRMLSLSKLLSGFFEFYSELDYDKYAISLFHKGIVEKKGSYRDLNQRELGKSKLVFVLEYPLQTNYNCSKDVTQDNAMLMKLEFYRANIIVQYINGDFHDLCKPVLH